MVSGLTRNQVPGNRLRVRIPCPPLAVLILANLGKWGSGTDVQHGNWERLNVRGRNG